MRFLTATVGSELRFHSRIRMHNLHPVELGAILWSLMLLDPSQLGEKSTRHNIGRAKNLGCGQLRVDRIALRATPNDAQASKLIVHGGTPGWSDDDPRNVQPFLFLEKFMEYAERRLAACGSTVRWQERQELRQLVDIASPTHNWNLLQAAAPWNPFSYPDRNRQGERVAGHKAHAEYKRWSMEDEADPYTSPDAVVRRLKTDA